MGPQGIIDLADELIYEDMSDWICYNKVFKKLLINADYDSYIFLFVIWLNKYIEGKLDEKCNAYKYAEISEIAKPGELAEYMETIKEWQKELRDEVFGRVDFFLKNTEQVLVEYRIPSINGLAEGIDVIGRNLAYSATKYDEKFERDWSVFDAMLALQYTDFAKAHIKETYVEKYIKANEFIIQQKVYIPMYYILCMDVYKVVDHREYKKKEYKHNFERIAKSLAELPEIYRRLLSEDSIYPTNRRVSDEGPISLILNVPFSRFLPSFVKAEKRYNYWDNYRTKDGKNTRVCHPMHQVMVPCTYLYTRTDVDLLIENSYRQVEFERVKKQIEAYEQGVGSDLEKNSKGEMYCLKIAILNKELLLERLKNHSSHTAKILNDLRKQEDETYEKSVRQKMQEFGFSRKVYYDCFNNHITENSPSPNKDTLIALIFCMQLGIEDANNLLISAGYVLSPAFERDIVIKHFIANGDYDLEKVNVILKELGLKQIRGRKM